MKRSVIGDSPRRREDQRFITGRGTYIDDLRFDNLARAVFVRSPHAHATIRSIDVAAARRAPGVLAVLTAADLAAYPTILRVFGECMKLSAFEAAKPENQPDKE